MVSIYSLIVTLRMATSDRMITYNRLWLCFIFFLCKWNYYHNLSFTIVISFTWNYIFVYKKMNVFVWYGSCLCYGFVDNTLFCKTLLVNLTLSRQTLFFHLYAQYTLPIWSSTRSPVLHVAVRLILKTRLFELWTFLHALKFIEKKSLLRVVSISKWTVFICIFNWYNCCFISHYFFNLDISF